MAFCYHHLFYILNTIIKKYNTQYMQRVYRHLKYVLHANNRRVYQPALKGATDEDVVVVPAKASLDLLIEEPQLHQENETCHTQQHVGPHLRQGAGVVRGSDLLSISLQTFIFTL